MADIVVKSYLTPCSAVTIQQPASKADSSTHNQISDHFAISL